MKKVKKILAVLLVGLIMCFILTLVSHAGDLEPSAAPAPTMKTMDEVEPRIPIPAASSRDPASTFVIAMPGSYYLAGDRYCTGTGIEVMADNVTIDLMGYGLSGPGSGTNYGIHMDARKNVEIRNGTVRYFQYGIYEEDMYSGKNHRAIDVRAVFNTQMGIVLTGVGNMIKDCTANDNGYMATSEVYGILGGAGSSINGNIANNNGTSATSNVFGIYTLAGSSVIGNTAYFNGDSATGSVYGIAMVGNNFVDRNTATNNNGTNMNSPSGCTFGINHAP